MVGLRPYSQLAAFTVLHFQLAVPRAAPPAAPVSRARATLYTEALRRCTAQASARHPEPPHGSSGKQGSRLVPPTAPQGPAAMRAPAQSPTLAKVPNWRLPTERLIPAARPRIAGTAPRIAATPPDIATCRRGRGRLPRHGSCRAFPPPSQGQRTRRVELDPHSSRCARPRPRRRRYRRPHLPWLCWPNALFLPVPRRRRRLPGATRPRPAPPPCPGFLAGRKCSLG